MNRWMIWLLGTALLVGGCGSTPRSELKPVTTPPSTQQAPEASTGAEKANPTPALAFDEKALCGRN